MVSREKPAAFCGGLLLVDQSHLLGKARPKRWKTSGNGTASKSELEAARLFRLAEFCI
jgi:hypothetical protein